MILRRSQLSKGAAWAELGGSSDCSSACHNNGKSECCVCFDLVGGREHLDDRVPYGAGAVCYGTGTVQVIHGTDNGSVEL